MNYKLSEEQSTEFYAKLVWVEDFAKRITEEALELARTYYGLYEIEREKHWHWRKRDFNWFLKTIGNDTGYQYCDSSYSSMGWEYITTRNLSGWVNHTKAGRVAKLTGLPVDEVQVDCNKIQRAAWYMMANRGMLYKIIEMKSNIENFMTVPYTLDDKWMDTYKFLDEHIEYWTNKNWNIGDSK